MTDNSKHVFQVLTKRADRLYELQKELKWTRNIWVGVSVENEKMKGRIDLLRKIKAEVKFLSLEPLIAPLPNLNLKKIKWVIVGGESGFKARPMSSEWALDIQRQCEKQKVKFFFKQWGGKNKKAAGRILNGRTYDEMPEITVL